MPKLSLSRSILIDAPIQTVFENVSDLNHWTEWSPWLIMEPEAKVTVADDGKYYAWQGSRTGQGEMRVMSEKENEVVRFDLTFLKPFKSEAKVAFHTKEENEGTQITWTMDTSLPWFMFWMKKSMETFIGMDYDRGLMLLKDYCEDGEVHSQLNFLGISQFEGFHYVGLKTQTTVGEIANKMQADFDKIYNIAEHENLEVKKTISIYHKFDPVKDIVDYTAAVSIPEMRNVSGLVSGTLPNAKIYTLEHVGPYEHLGNAWSTISNMIRNKEIKVVKGVHPWETYVNDPSTTEPHDLITHINFVVK